VLANTICFRGKWRYQFQQARTRDADFYLADGNVVKVPMMGQPADDVHYAAFRADGSLFDTPAKVRRGEDTARCYPDSSGFAMVEIPYREERLSMVVIAPNRPDGLEAIEEMCDAETLARWIQAGRKRPVELYLPTFRSETGYDLNETLASMGMTSAFRSPGMPSGADFSGMDGSQEPDSQLFISLVAHRAFIRVNEEGTEAAAATAVIMKSWGVTRFGEMISFIPVFRADRPFLYLIRDARTGVVLFLGRMMNPA
jgi:serpin B